jgi:hypothetical protein
MDSLLDNILTSNSAAQRLRKSPDWLGRNARRLGIPRYRVGGRWYYNPSELDEWVRQQRDRTDAVPRIRGQRISL